MAWYSSWIPGLPNFNFSIPTSIQGHFISFVLKKFLGHLLTPGQLDYRQIDSQIGSGYVQINDLVLSPEAVNGYLTGLPLILQDGTITSIKVRVPWPNPLASTLGFSLNSAHLKFCVATVRTSVGRSDIDLTDSVASVAETFIHEELSLQEEASLWRSLRHEISGQPEIREGILPGGLDTSTNASDIHKFDMDPTGISVFAGLIERLLARFEFDAQDIKITLIHPQNISLTLSLQDLRYHTDTASPPNFSTETHVQGVQGERHTLSINGISLSSRDLSIPLSPSSLSIEPASDSGNVDSSPPSHASSDTPPMDEDARYIMAQPLAFLPSRPSSPSGSASSSMYASAISKISSTYPASGGLETKPVVALSQLDEDVMVSLRSEPVIFKITTPSNALVPEDDPFLFSPTTRPEDQLHLTLSVGILGCVLRPWQILSLSRLANAMAMSGDQSNAISTRKVSPERAIPPIKMSADVRAAVLLLISTHLNPTLSTIEFFDRPLVPPESNFGYTRILLDSLAFTLSVDNKPPFKDTGPGTSHPLNFSALKSLEISVVDISVFLFSKAPKDMTSNLHAFPLLITDPHLPSQYHRPHIHRQNDPGSLSLPNFDVIDWKCVNYGTRLSHWRCYPSRANPADRTFAHPESGNTSAQNPSQPAIRLIGRRTAIANGDKYLVPHTVDDVDIDVAPLHIRIDLQYILQPEGPITFFEDILLSDILIVGEKSCSSESTVDKSFVTPERSKLSEKGYSHNNPRSESTSGFFYTTINFHAVRLSICCPPPPQFVKRSGILTLDFNGTTIIVGSKPPKPSTKFARPDDASTLELNMSDESVLLQASFNRIVLACSLVNETSATAFLSIGPLTDDISTQSVVIEDNTSFLEPRFLIIKPTLRDLETVPTMAVSFDIPSVLVDISKPIFDSLQYWADDASQLLERLSIPGTEVGISNSGDTSLIGSRFFARSRTDSGRVLASSTSEVADFVIKFSISEAAVSVLIPRTDDDRSDLRPIYINASDLDILIELNPDRKQQTILTIGIMNLTMENISKENTRQRLLGLTSPHSLTTASKSILKLRFSTATLPETSGKETRIKLTLCGFTFTFFPDLYWISDLVAFAKNPPGTFESVIPSVHTRIFVKICDGSIRVLAPIYPGALVSYMQELEFSTDVIGDSRDSSFHVTANSLALLAIDDVQDQVSNGQGPRPFQGVSSWMTTGYALLAEVSELDMSLTNQLAANPSWKLQVERVVLRLHLCADSLIVVTMLSQDLRKLFERPEAKPKLSNRNPAVVGRFETESTTIMSSVEDLAFKKIPEIGPAADMIYDDLPTNMDYLDESFGAAAGLRELVDEDFDDFEDREIDVKTNTDDSYIISSVGGETVKLFDPQGLDLVEDYYPSIPPEKPKGDSRSNDANFSVRILDGNVNLFLHDGYDWGKTRKTIEEEVKEMRKRLAKIRQLVANGQMQEPIVEDTSAFLFNSIHIGLDQDVDGFEEPSALIAAIDEELKDDLETASQSSWQTLHPPTYNKPRGRSTRIYGRKLTRSRMPSIEFSLAGISAEFDQFKLDDPLVSRTLVTIRDLEILDHIKTSTWKKFLTELRSDSRGNIRETDSNMVRIELTGIRPVEGNSSEEVRLRAKILPLRLYVDQDAVDFLKKFFSFKVPSSAYPPDAQLPDERETFIQLGEIFPVDLKLDYKPRRVDYRALKEGRTIELMNFFHFDGAEMTLRHITLAGVTGWPRFFEMLNDLWTPDVKATQLAEVISGVAPIRSIVNVGSGVADLILLPIAQYQKDGRIVRGVQKGATAFVKSTAIEAIKMGAKLATGTQVILEQAEGILGGRLDTPITAEPVGDEFDVDNVENDGTAEMISKYAQQPTDLKEGVQSAYKSLQRNLNSAAQTILAVPMEVYERSGNEGPVRSVIRAVPIAVLKPMIGASEAVSKTLLGLHNTLDPSIRHDNEAKYKLR
ncbi:hypothetical protein BDN70DRAFT_887253 [Pholiota conissans]|uniref:Autophagy-related protein 2 n=1 Tax=Pholiota conissans TaxID=109636 RepID=A0A9P5YNQ2_9AGAR|nr:hypothetical protein BDN70DRAFT_887253 [Pholiota conissans]